jgi:hypothetical protein
LSSTSPGEVTPAPSADAIKSAAPPITACLH